MPRCEMCGEEESDLTAVCVSHAELDVCEACSDLGTPLDTSDESDDETTTKYSTSSTEETAPQSEATPSTGETGPRSGSEMVPSIVPDYAERVQEGRQQSQLTIEELADRLNEKASYLQKIERAEMQPNTTLQMQLEQFLNIDLSPAEDDQWDSDSSES